MRFTRSEPEQFNFQKTILLVEDEAPVRLLMWHILNEAGYRVILANDGIDGERKLLTHGDEIDLLLTDLSMPGISGLELAQRAKILKPNIAVVYATGSQDCFPETRGDVVCLTKPFTVEELLTAVAAKLQPGEVSPQGPKLRRNREILAFTNSN